MFRTCLLLFLLFGMSTAASASADYGFSASLELDVTNSNIHAHDSGDTILNYWLCQR